MDVSDGKTTNRLVPRDPERFFGLQRREAFRVGMRLAVHVESPMQLYCELIDISVLGARLDRELPCTPGVRIRFTLEIPSYGVDKPHQIELQGAVVRVNGGNTGLRFTELTPEQTREVRELVNEQQRLILAVIRAKREEELRESQLREQQRREGPFWFQ
jgi:c-di-GMP-binding flagellar brake protein YcgR